MQRPRAVVVVPGVVRGGAMALSVLLAVLVGSPAFALDPGLDVDQYAHTSWKIREGFAKGAITSIAQTADGYLWLGTEFGLLRFDGVRTVPWAPPRGQALPSNWIRDVLAARDGTLWISTLKGVASWKDGRLNVYAKLADQSPWRLLEDREGVVWIGTFGAPSGRLCAIREGEAECYGDDGRFGAGVTRVYEDSKGQLWVGVRSGLWRWRPAPPSFYPLSDEPNGVDGVSEDEDGALLVGVRGEIRRLVDGRTTPYPLLKRPEPFQTRQILRDRDGGLWIGTKDRGLVHVHQGSTDMFTRADGLSANYVIAVFEDRESDIWVATVDGLDRFHDLAVPTYSVRQGLSSEMVGAVLAAADGSVWIGSRTGLTVWRSGQLTTPRIEAGKHGKPDLLNLGSLHQDAHGRTWVSTFVGGLGSLENDRFALIRGIPGGNVWGIADDAAGNLWIANHELGLFRLSAQREVEQFPWADLGRKDPATSLAADPRGGGVWMGFASGGLAYAAEGRVRKWYGAADGLGEGRVSDLRFDPDGTLWAATEGGLSRLKGSRIATLTTRNGLPCDAVHWSIEDEDRAFWLNTACGLVRVARSEVDAAADAAEPGGRTGSALRTTVFDLSDGVRARGLAGNYKPQVARSRDGRIWFPSGDGVSVIDPRHLHVNALPPPVHVEQVTADHKAYDAGPAGGRLRLPPSVRDVQIDYTALSLVAPEKIRFRYMLEGWDREWQDAGNRREAIYANLPPRDYRFRVLASNNSGVWNETGAALDFAVDPAYYQTAWFRVAVAALFLGATAALYRMRVRQVAQRVRLRMEGRLEERERIARDLHDTLLQSVQGLILKFDAAARKIPAGDPARHAIEETLDRADAILAEGRDRVRSLRGTGPALNDLPAAFERIAREAAPGSATTFRSVVEGHVRGLDPIVLEESFTIGREALLNALAHSGALHVELEIAYDASQFRLRIRDDGRGIDPEILGQGGRSDHWGLQGMRERARRIGANLELWSRPGAGTEVELKVPAATAHRSARAADTTSQ